MIFDWYSAGNGANRQPFPFFTHNMPLKKLVFSDVTTNMIIRQSHKRPRAKTDVDGEGSGTMQKKKRRLRLNLITSRLSRPYATPTTHIVSRGMPKTSLRWTRRRMMSGDLLRKAAIINSAKAKHLDCKNNISSRSSQRSSELSSFSEDILSNIDRPPRGERNDLQATTTTIIPCKTHRAPLSPESYNAFDLESDLYNDDEWEDIENENENESINSDFNNRIPTDSSNDEYEYCMPRDEIDFPHAPRPPQ